MTLFVFFVVLTIEFNHSLNSFVAFTGSVIYIVGTDVFTDVTAGGDAQVVTPACVEEDAITLLVTETDVSSFEGLIPDL